MKYADATTKLAEYRSKIAEIREAMREVQAAIEPQAVKDYVFQTSDGEVKLSELFGDKNDLIVIHNMGASCPYCTMWADGYNGIYDHLADRAAFVVSTPDAPVAQKSFASKRGWRFPMVSHKGTSFAADMGYVDEAGGFLPGISAFQRRNGRVVRVSNTDCGPSDDFCALWHLVDLLPEGAGDWEPRFKYT